MSITYLDGPRLRRSLLAATAYVRADRAELNRINVFPVPDGDTGSNLALTTGAIASRLEEVMDREISRVSREAATAAVVGARGNSGMLLSQFLLGFADCFEGKDRASSGDVAEAFLAGSERLEGSLDKPAEGTIVTVVRDTAMAGIQTTTEDIADLLSQLVEAARTSLARTPDLLPVLRESGVVDAGAKGFVSLLEGILGALEGRDLPPARPEPTEGEKVSAAARVEFSPDGDGFRYCTEGLVQGAELPDEGHVRGLLREKGDSLIVIRTGETLKVHIHTNAPEEVFDTLRDLGRLVTHKAEDLEAQHDAIERADARHVTLARRPVGIVTDSACDLPEEVVVAHGIRIVPVEIIAGDRTYRDRIEISAEEFHDRLAREDTLFTTSQPAPGAFVEGFEEAAQDAEELVAITLASGLSGTYRSAEAASRLFEGAPVHLMDTQGISLLQGLLVLKAAELAEGGTPPAQIVQELYRVRAQSGIFLTVDRFDRLLASGRVRPGVAWIGSRLGLKPILRVDDDGTVVRAGQTLGRRRVLPALIRKLEREIPASVERVRFGMVHVGRPELVDEVSAALRERWGDVEILSRPATPVIATHVGLGAWAVAYMVED